MFFLYFFILLISFSNGEQWEELEDFNETFTSYTRSAEDVIETMEDLVDKTRANAIQFLYNLDSSPYVRPPNEMKHDCLPIYDYLKPAVQNFKIVMVHLETEIFNKKNEIKERLYEISSQIDLYQTLAENEYRNCLINGEETCKQQTSNWLREKVTYLQCRVTNVCEKLKSNHTIKKRSVCGQNEFECLREERCIQWNYVCNGQTDCEDGSDEHVLCSRHCLNGFHCRNLRCLDKSYVCDGRDDCGDMSDEEDCPLPLYTATNCSIGAGQYLCTNRECVVLAAVCDGRRDCSDGSDEDGKCGEVTLCPTDCLVGGGVCFAGPRGPLCLSSCPGGLKEVEGRCLQDHQLPAANLALLIEGIPAVITRYLGAVGYHKRLLIDGLNNALDGCKIPKAVVHLGLQQEGERSFSLTNLEP